MRLGAGTSAALILAIALSAFNPIYSAPAGASDAQQPGANPGNVPQAQGTQINTPTKTGSANPGNSNGQTKPVATQTQTTAKTPTAKNTDSPCGPATSSGETQNQDGQSNTGASAAWFGTGAIDGMCKALTGLLGGGLSQEPVLVTTNTNSWFAIEFKMFVGISLWVAAPMLIIATIAHALKGDTQKIIKTYTVYLPVSIVGGFVAAGVVQVNLHMTEDFTKLFTNSISANALRYFTGVSDGFGAEGFNAGIPFLVMIVTAIMMIAVSIAMYVILTLRAASIYLSVAFFPIVLAFFIWPSTAHFLKKSFQFEMAMIWSKLIMVAGVALVIAAMASRANVTPNGATIKANGSNVGVATGQATESNAGWATWFAQTLSTEAMFGIVAFAPAFPVKLLAKVSLEHAGDQVADGHKTPDLTSTPAMLDRHLKMLSDTGGGIRSLRSMGPAREDAARRTLQGDALTSLGYPDGPVDDSDAKLGTGPGGLNIDPAQWGEIRRRLRSGNAMDRAVAMEAMIQGEDFERFGDYNVVLLKNRAGGPKGAVWIAPFVNFDGTMNDNYHQRFNLDAARSGTGGQGQDMEVNEAQLRDLIKQGYTQIEMRHPDPYKERFGPRGPQTRYNKSFDPTKDSQQLILKRMGERLEAETGAKVHMIPNAPPVPDNWLNSNQTAAGSSFTNLRWRR